MIGILIIIPLVVLLVMGLVTTFISVSAYIGVESVSLDKHEVTLEVQKTYKLDGANGLFVVTVLPERATDKTYEWSVRNVRSRDANFPDESNGQDGFWFVELLDANMNHVDTVTAGGYLRVNVHCNFELVVTAETYTDVCSVVVGGDVTAISLQGDGKLRVGESAMLSAVYTPLDGAVYNTEWFVADSHVATVDRNGIVTGVEEGETEVWLVAQDSKGNSIESAHFTVTVSSGATYYGDIVGVHYDGFNIEEALGISPAKINECVGCSVEGGIFRFDEGSDRAVILLDGSDTPVLINRCDENDIEIVEMGALGDYVLEVNGAPVYLTARYVSVFRRGENVNVTWSSSAPEIAKVTDSGEVSGLSSGTVTVTAQATDGGAIATIDLSVQRKVAVLVGAVSQSSLEVGLALETVFGSMKYDGSMNLVDNTYSVGVLYPSRFEGEDEESFYDAFEFSTDRPDLAWFDTESGNGIMNNVLTFNSAAIASAAANGEKIAITVTIKAKYPKYANMPQYTTTSVTLNVVDGVAVSNYSQLKKAAETDRKAAVFTCDIPVENASGTDRAYSVNLFESVYGNGYTISAAMGQMNGKSEPVFYVYADDVTISNMTVRPNTFSDEDIDSGNLTIDDASTFDFGYCVKYNVNHKNSSIGQVTQQITGGRIEYCILENATTLIQLSGAEVEIEGSILRNTSGVGVHVRNTKESNLQFYNNLTITNSVMSNMVGTAINFDWNYKNTSYDETAERRSTFTQKGFLDVYNWQPGDSLSLLPRETLTDDLGLSDGLADLLIATLQNLLKSESSIESFRRNVDGVEYMHLAFISMGLNNKSHILNGYLEDGTRAEWVYNASTKTWEARISATQEPVDPDLVSWNFSTEDKRFKWFGSTQIEALASVAGILNQVGINLTDNPIYIFGYDDGTTDLVPGSTYTVNSRLIARLHGEEV